MGYLPSRGNFTQLVGVGVAGAVESLFLQTLIIAGRDVLDEERHGFPGQLEGLLEHPVKPEGIQEEQERG